MAAKKAKKAAKKTAAAKARKAFDKRVLSMAVTERPKVYSALPKAKKAAKGRGK